jgi:hypothetical protein
MPALEALVRKNGIVISLVLATALGGALAYRSLHPAGGEQASRAHERIRTPETGAIYKLHEAVPNKAPVAQAPALSLTASDGTGLRLASLDAKGIVEGQLAFTELRLAFDNPDDRTVEGTFRIVLPQGAAISRFAMRIGDRWQEGEVVEKQAARQAYEDFLHRKQDPALLEQAAGNEFSARVFPIPARGRKELIVSYSQELSAEAPYLVPLKGLPVIEKLDLVVTRTGDDAPILGQLHSEQKAPEGDFLIDPSKVPAGDGLRSGDIALVRVRPLGDAGAGAGADVVSSAIVLVDTSASRALGFEAQVQLVAELASQLASQGAKDLTVAAFDQGIDIAYEGPASGFAASGPARLRERQAFGASDLEGALTWAREQAGKRKATRVVLVSDGVPTLGATDGAQLKAAAARLKSAGVERLDAVAVGGLRDDALLRGLATAGLARDGIVADGARGAAVVTRKLNAATRSNVAVKIEGATWQWPERLDGVQPGDEVLVYAELPATNGVKVTVGAVSTSPTLAAVDRNLLERAWAQAKIASLVQKPPAGLSEAQVKEQVVALSVKHRVLSPHTSLLVLESERDYARFKIDRKALADILTIEGTRLATLHRSDDPAKLGDAAPPRKQDSDGPVLRAPPPPPDAPERRAEKRAAPSKPAGNRQDNGHDSRADNKEGGIGTRAKGEEGSMMRAAKRLPAAPGMIDARQPAHEDSFAAPEPRPAADDGTVPTGSLDALANQGPIMGGSGKGGLKMTAGGAPAAKAKRAPGGLAGIAGAGAVAGGSGRSLADGSGASPAAAGSLRAPRTNLPGGVAAHETARPREAQFGPYAGKMAEVMTALSKGDKQAALDLAIAFRNQNPGDVMALVATGEAFEAMGETRSAARAYGSIIDLFSSRADLRRMAGERLERLGNPSSLSIAADSFAVAVEQRPDHPASHRLLAFARLRQGDHAGAFDAIEAGASRNYTEGRFRGVDRILREDMGLIAAAWLRAEPWQKLSVEARLQKAGAQLETGPSVRFVLNWETDANDVDFHIHDGKGGHAYFSQKTLPSGGELYADVTTGYGPECFTARLSKAERASPYRLQAHYYSRGPMGYGMGKLEIIDHDGQGNLTFEERPFVVMQDRAFVELGTYPASTAR